MRRAATLLKTLSAERGWSYHPGGPTATEPAALAALALLAHQQFQAAQPALDWLVRHQAADGSLGVTGDQPTPCWPTSLAVLAWAAADQAAGQPRYKQRIARAVDWLLQAEGTTSPRAPQVGHDTTLVGWPWVLGTHSWLEPTALSVLALKATGHAQHPRTQQAVRLLVDRQLAHGGCNFGNTGVLGQETLPHVQPTGLAMMALAGEIDDSGRLDLSLDYLASNLHHRTATASLCYGLLGLTAHGRLPEPYGAWLDAAFARTRSNGASTHKLALLALADLAERSPLIQLTRPAPRQTLQPETAT